MDGTSRRKYLTNGELREEIAYAVGADPSPYGYDSNHGLNEADRLSIAQAVGEPETLDGTGLHILERHICEQIGHEYEQRAQDNWKLDRPTLKAIHEAVGAEDPRAVVEA